MARAPPPVCQEPVDDGRDVWISKQGIASEFLTEELDPVIPRFHPRAGRPCHEFWPTLSVARAVLRLISSEEAVALHSR
jgi:hypothetical protein